MMTFNSTNEFRRTVPPSSHGEIETFDDEFDRLLEQSSLGSPNARAIQALTSEDVVDTIQDRVNAQAPSGSLTNAGPDVDDLLLDLVRCAALPNDYSTAQHHWSSKWPAQRYAPTKLAFLVNTSSMGKSAYRGMLTRLAEANVFGYVRRDIARSVLDIAFRSGCAPRTTLVLLVASVLTRSGIADELTAHLRRQPLGARTETQGGSPPQRDTENIQRAGCVNLAATPYRAVIDICLAATRQEPEAAKPNESCPEYLIEDTANPSSSAFPIQRRRRSDNRMRVLARHDMPDDTAVAIELFVVQWLSMKSAFKEGPSIPYTTNDSSVKALTTPLLERIHEASQVSGILTSTTDQYLGLSNLSPARVDNVLKILSDASLVHPSTILAVRSRLLCQLTDCGLEAFHQWLIAEPDET
jgi:hypothetical protein